MTNATQNRINTVLTAEQEQKIKDGIALINEALRDVYRSLTPRERQTIPKINRANDLFVKDALTAVQQAPEAFPRSYNVQHMQNDYTLYNQLKAHTLNVQALYEKLSDTMMLAGSESYISALLAYRYVGASAASGEQGMQTLYKSLRQRFDIAGNDLAEAPAAEATAS
ncbi:hypothetical protein [Flaviaesturariibacter aridisoli]|uniref:Uncharacterized protein n=1 Tax=Flaviaesturariibacter aridisoli TaxID=2545761 RepID=A0A4R4E170_9BACT|nr:hypothetical protein [Flaviaesturariibacter aridisoli]TCZ71788.1 hypothetical protein E0486_09565 [Flaviaesturariibacter aridisoli]